MSAKLWLALGALYGALAVILGALGAHALLPQGEAAAQALARFRTAQSYHFYHALALLAVGLLAQSRPSVALTFAGACFGAGVLLFCGSLYLSALQLAPPSLAPLGGVLLILGWLALIWAALR